MNLSYARPILRIFSVALAVSAATVANADSDYYVRVDGSRVRTEPDRGSESTVLGLLSIGTKVRVVEKKGRWVKVKVGNETGWVNANLLRKNKSTTPAASTAALPMPVPRPHDLDVKKADAETPPPLKKVSRAKAVAKVDPLDEQEPVVVAKPPKKVATRSIVLNEDDKKETPPVVAPVKKEKKAAPAAAPLAKKASTYAEKFKCGASATDLRSYATNIKDELALIDEVAGIDSDLLGVPFYVKKLNMGLQAFGVSKATLSILAGRNLIVRAEAPGTFYPAVDKEVVICAMSDHSLRALKIDSSGSGNVAAAPVVFKISVKSRGSLLHISNNESGIGALNSDVSTADASK